MIEKEKDNNLKHSLWDVANILRGKMDPDEFKNYMLGFIFFKQLSHNLLDELEKQKISIEEIKNYSSKTLEELKNLIINGRAKGGGIGFYFNPKNTFFEIVNKIKQGEKEFVCSSLKEAFAEIVDSTQGYESNEDFIGLFSDINLDNPKLGSDDKEVQNTVSKILLKINDVQWNGQNDVLGDAYEFLISNFASSAGKRGGEFYTPPQVSVVLAKIISSHESDVKSVYDPTCGSGSLLIKAYSELKNKYSKTKALGIKIYGQELNHTTYNLARMNMFLHNINHSSFKIRQGDTLFNDRFPEYVEDNGFSAIVANPPFGTKWDRDEEKISNDPRFYSYGSIAPKSRAEFAFVQHMLHHLKDDGIMATVLPNGVLFRGGTEGEIRKFMIEKGWIDTIIALPENLFFGTGIPAIIVVFKKNKKEEDPILFIDAQLCFQKIKIKNELSEESVEKIYEIYNQRKEVDTIFTVGNEEKRIISKFVKKGEIIDESYNLNISRYIDNEPKEKFRKLSSINEDINKLENEIKELKEPIEKLFNDLNIK